MSDWIKCSERMPECKENDYGKKSSNKILITDGDDVYKAVYQSFEDKTSRWLICPDCDTLEGNIPIITHWMEIPEIK